MRLRTYCSLALLLVYVLGIVTPMEHHHLDDVMGSGRAVLMQHEDADHCKHVPLAVYGDCALCAMYNGKATEAVSASPVLGAPFREVVCAVQQPYFHSLHFLSSQSHRGPPASMA